MNGLEPPPAELMLELLAEDIASHPERMRVVDSELRARAQLLVEGIDIDLDSPLSESSE
jgi:antitoxin PrlF